MSKITNIFCVGFVVTSFYEVMVRVLPYARILGPDTRAPKEILSVWFALIIGLLGAHYGVISKIGNKWVLLLVGYLLFSVHSAPHFPILINEIDSSNFWVWKPLFQIACFFFMFWAIQSAEFSGFDIKRIFNVLRWCGVIMAGYVIIQSFGIEQFFTVRSVKEIGTVTAPQVVGVLGNSTIVSAYLALLLPFVLFGRFYVSAGFIFLAICLCKSDMSTASAVLILVVFLWSVNWKAGIAFFLIALTCGLLFWSVNKSGVFNPNGRIEVWKSVAMDATSKTYGSSDSAHPITGNGIGSFSYLWPQDRGSFFRQAHNEYLDIYFQLGIVGLALFLIALFYPVFGRALYVNPDIYSAARLSLVASMSLACGTFIWQVSPHDFLCVFSFGILNNKTIGGVI